MIRRVISRAWSRHPVLFDRSLALLLLPLGLTIFPLWAGIEAAAREAREALHDFLDVWRNGW